MLQLCDAGSKTRKFSYRDIKSKLKILSLEVDSSSAHETELSMKAICSGYWLLCFRLMKNVSCEYDRRVVETQLCKVRDTSDTLIARCRIVSFCLVISPREVLPLFISLFI